MEEHPLPGEIGEAARLFLKEQISKRRCETTVLKHRRNLSYFIVFLEPDQNQNFLILKRRM